MTLAADIAHSRHQNWKSLAAEALAGTGVHASRAVHANLTAPALVAEALRRNEGNLSVDGALVVATGVHTGRSARDKFVVDEPAVTGEVWWGKVNNRLAPEKFAVLKARVQAYLQGQELFTQDLYAGAEPEHRVRVRLVSTGAWQTLFARNIFIRPRPEELADFQPDYVILHAPHFQTDPAIDGVRSGTSIALSFGQRVIIIAGTEYAGEIKKSIFTVMNWILPERGVLPMHCSANVGNQGDVALFFGLSGTGKTTLSSDPHRKLIGDDEHGWGDNGVFNFEGGCYAKVINLSAEHEPEIWSASHRFGTVLENVVADAHGRLDLTDQSLTENTRSAYPVEYIPNIELSLRGGQPRNVVMLTCDAFGVMPPIAKLTPAQAMYHFLSGYTALVAGTGERPRRGAAGDVQHLLRCSVPAAPPRSVWTHAGGTDRAPQCGLLAGEHRLERRSVRCRSTHGHPAHACAVARRAGWQPRPDAVSQGALFRTGDPRARAGHPRRGTGSARCMV